MSGHVMVATAGLRRAGASRKVQLPVTANPRSVPSLIFTLVGVSLGCLGLSCLVAAALAFPHLVTFQAVGGFVLLILLGVFGALVFACSIVCAGDLFLKRPVIVLDEGGIADRRASDEVIRWDNVERAISFEQINGGVLLELRDPIETRVNRFRIGTFGFVWKKPSGSAYVSLSNIVGPSLPRGAILALAARHGASVFERLPFEKLRPVTIVADHQAQSTPLNGAAELSPKPGV